MEIERKNAFDEYLKDQQDSSYMARLKQVDKERDFKAGFDAGYEAGFDAATKKLSK